MDRNLNHVASVLAIINDNVPFNGRLEVQTHEVVGYIKNFKHFFQT